MSMRICCGSDENKPHEKECSKFCNQEHAESLIYRLRKRAEIRRSIQTRKSVQEGKPDRISDLLEEAANLIETLISK